MRRVNDLLAAKSSPLGALVRGARRQQRLDALLAGFLDRPLADHVQVASGDADVLVLAADAPVWGHRIRYLAPAILERMRGEAPQLRDVRIIVRPPAWPPARAAARERRTQPSARQDADAGCAKMIGTCTSSSKVTVSQADSCASSARNSSLLRAWPDL